MSDTRRAWRIVTPPEGEPVTLEEAKLHLRVDGSDEDDAISQAISAARERAERVSGLAFLTRTIELCFDERPGAVFEIPCGPLVSVQSVTFYDQEGAGTTVPSSDYAVDTVGVPGRVALKRSAVWPAVDLAPLNGVRVLAVVGFGSEPATIPQAIRRAILLLVAHYHENRQEFLVGGGMTGERVPEAARALLTSERRKWL